MDLRILRGSRWKVLAPIRRDEQRDTWQCDLIDELETLAARQYASAVSGILKMLEICAESGLDSLPRDWSHLADRENGIYEFIKGDLRLLYFKASSGAVVVCSHVFVKKSRKTPDAEKKKAARVKTEYEAASRSGKLNILEKE